MHNNTEPSYKSSIKVVPPYEKKDKITDKDPLVVFFTRLLLCFCKRIHDAL